MITISMAHNNIRLLAKISIEFKKKCSDQEEEDPLVVQI